MNIKNRIVRAASVKWKDLQVLQHADLKRLDDVDFERLKRSLTSNNFVCTFYVWDEEGTYWVLDGVHRLRALRALEVDGAMVPEYLPAVFVDCEDRKEAIQMILVFSSQYAEVTDGGMAEFIQKEGIDFDSSVFNVPNFDHEALLAKLGSTVEPEDLSKEKVQPCLRAGGCPKCGSKSITDLRKEQ